jgi:hypothetical protein
LNDGALLLCEEFGIIWYANGKLVAATKKLESGHNNIAHVGGLVQPQGSELSVWSPVVTIHNGSFRFTSIELMF